MRHFQARQAQIYDTHHPFPENQPARQHNDRTLLPAPPAPPPTDQTPARPREREARHIVHADRDRNPARQIRLPGLALAHDPQRRRDREDAAPAQRPLPRHSRQALARDEAGGEDPHVRGRDLEHTAGDGVHARVELVHGRRDDGADEGADQLPVELGFRRRAEEVAGLEVLHHVAGLQGAGLGDGAREQVDDDSVGVGGRDQEREGQLCELGDAGDGVEVCFAEGAHAHEGEEEGHEDGEECCVKGDKGGEDDVCRADAEGDGGEEAEINDSVADKMFRWGVGFRDGAGLLVGVLRGGHGGGKGCVSAFGGGRGKAEEGAVVAAFKALASFTDVVRAVLDRGTENEPAKTDNRVCKHDRQADPDDPTFATSLPFCDWSWRPTFVLGQGRQYSPTDHSTQEHVEGCCWAHDYALSDVCWGRIESPEPIVGERET